MLSSSLVSGSQLHSTCQGDYAAARALYAESLAIQRELEDKLGLPFTLNCLGEVLRCQGDYAGAGECYEESLALWRQLGIQEGVAGMLSNLGHVAQHQGDDRRAVAFFAESLALCRALGSQPSIAICLAGLAGVAGAAGQPERAARLFGAAEALLEAVDAHVLPADRADYERGVAAVRAALSAEAFAAAWAEGRALPLELAIALALEGH
jgi:tetratricopeptide (TPR) repeat protein